MNTRAHWRLILGIACVFLCFGVVLTLATTPDRGDRGSELPGRISAPVHPVTVLLTVKTGGTVTEVLHKPGDRVRKDDVLLRLDPAALRAARAALQSWREVSLLPSSVRAAMMEVHPEVTAAEDRYVRAVAALDRVTASDSAWGEAQADWKRADRERTEVRERLGRSLSSGGGSAGLAAVVPDLEARLRELDRALAETEVRAPADAVIDILDLRPGARLLPGGPAAVLLLPDQYFAEFALPVSAAARLSVGAESSGTMVSGGELFRWQIESLQVRTVPVGLREDREVTKEMLVRARFSVPAVPPGSHVRLDLPQPQLVP